MKPVVEDKDDSEGRDESKVRTYFGNSDYHYSFARKKSMI